MLTNDCFSDRCGALLDRLFAHCVSASLAPCTLGVLGVPKNV